MKNDCVKTAKEILKCQNGFFQNAAGEGTVIGTCAALSLNLKGFLFPGKCAPASLKRIVEALNALLEKKAKKNQLQFTKFSSADENALNLLYEKNLLLAKHATRFMAYACWQEFSALINGADHLKLITCDGGYNVAQLEKNLSALKSEIEETVNFSFDTEFGYLTASPETVGTALKFETLVHMPCLSLTGGLLAMLKHLNALGVSYKTFTGGHESDCGDFFILSNSFTIGKTAQETAKDFDNAVWYVEAAEERAKSLLLAQKIKPEDKIWRSIGILSNARSMGYNEMAGHISVLRFAAFMGIETGKKTKGLTKYLLTLKPVHIAAKFKNQLPPEKENEIRAAILRKHITA